ncbi:MAG: hypothetical protein HUJ68_06835 [Clostridia bacterium]|nr:hypothetical protein [Clostridia bacterium]
MNQEKELQRHEQKLERIRNAKTKEELPAANISAVTKYLANNSSFDGNKISPSEFKTVLDAIMEYNFFIMPEVKEVYIQVLKKNFPDRTQQEYEEKYLQIAQASNIGHYIIEASERSAKLQEFKEKEELEQHNENMKQIKSSFELKDLPKVGIGTLNGKIMKATKNDFIERFSIEQIREISEMLMSEKHTEEEIEEKISNICQTYGFDEEQTNLMYQQIENQIFLDKTIGYTIEEIKEKEQRVLQIYKMDHEETMENIKNARRISEMPPNLIESALTGYLSGNTTIYPKVDKISTTDLKDVTSLLLQGNDFSSFEVEEELRKVVQKYYPEKSDEAFKLLKERFEKLPRTQYLVDEINYSNERQAEFIGRQCSNVNVYFIPNPNSPIEGGKFYNCYINRVKNLDLGKLLSEDVLDLDKVVPKGMDVDSIEWYIQKYYDETFKTAGGIILNRDETIVNVNVFRPSGGSVGITPEENEQRMQLQELSKEVKQIIANKRASSDRFKEMQAAYISYQEETDKQLEALEKKIDNLMQPKNNGDKNNEINDSDKELEL